MSTPKASPDQGPVDGRGGTRACSAGQTDRMKLSRWETNSVFGSRLEIPSDRYLFHYTSVERCATIGFTGGIALGPLTPLNDPRESQLRQVMTMTTGDRHGARYVSGEERKEFERNLWRLRGRVRLACFTVDQTDGERSKRDDLRGYAHSRMWTQYAAGHGGVCLVFDRAQLLSTAHSIFDSRFHHRAVDYTSGFDQSLHDAELVDFDRPNPQQHHRVKVVPSLFVKNRDWESESEYRLLLDEWDEIVCLLPIADALVGVALGASFMPYQLPVIESLAEKFDLGDQVAHMIVNMGVLQAWPCRDRAGMLRVWTDDDTRTRHVVFDPEDGVESR